MPILDRPDGARENTREQWLASGFGLLAWCCFVGALLWLIGSSGRPVPRVTTPQLSVELFEDAPPPVAPAAAPAPARAEQAAPAAQDIALKPPLPHPPKPPRVPKVTPSPEPAPAPAPKSVPAQTTTPSTAQAATQASADTANASKTSANPAAGPRADSSATGPSSNGNAPNGPARATYQPLPDIPDDYRSEAFAAVALARFTVHPDGSAEVSLVEATHNPTLNRMLLASLKQWRFAAAVQDGHPVETTIELRVHFNVH